MSAGIVAAAQLVLPSTMSIYRPAPASPALSSPQPGDQRLPNPIYPAIAEHPLFYPTRMPYVRPKTPEPAAAGVPTLLPLHDYTLIGIVVSQGVRMALLRPNAGGKTVFATEGQAIDGWTLREIRPDRLHFANGAASLDLRFASPRWPHP
jgi:hypothetical protein